jgi:hypothetical protein
MKISANLKRKFIFSKSAIYRKNIKKINNSATSENENDHGQVNIIANNGGKYISKLA